MFESADVDVISTFRTRIAEPFFTGVFPEGCFLSDFLYGATLLALSTAPKPGSRPIAIGAALRRLSLKAVLPGLHEGVADYFTNAHPHVIQLAGGVEDYSLGSPGPTSKRGNLNTEVSAYNEFPANPNKLN
jgi:hypothetical protein